MADRICDACGKKKTYPEVRHAQVATSFVIAARLGMRTARYAGTPCDRESA